MGGSRGSGTPANTSTRIKYAGYVESKHQAFLNSVAEYRENLSTKSPFSDFIDIDINTAFLGSGIAISSFSSVFATFDSFMRDVDIDSLYTSIMNSTLSNDAVKNAVVAEGKLLSDDITTETLPRLMAGARDMNAVMSSTFIIAKGNLETKRLKLLEKFSSNLKFSLLNLGHDRWKNTLEWKKQVAYTYMELIKLYFSATFDATNINYSMAAKDTLWPFTLLDSERAALGALQAARSSNTSVHGSTGPSDGASAIGGALTGAAAGAYLGGGPIGAAVGGIVGGLAGLIDF